MHLKVADWILDAACVYYIATQFVSVTVRQAIGLLSSVVTDSAIETQTGLVIPDRPSGRYNGKNVRSVSVLSIDHETISRRKKAHQCHNYHAESHQQETCCEMSHAEKWEWVIRNARQRKR
ncbi:hypothetical protein BRR55_12845 [Salmonella enterica]|nr:hypothetical protein [Salmonella enterica]